MIWFSSFSFILSFSIAQQARKPEPEKYEPCGLSTLFIRNQKKIFINTQPGVPKRLSECPRGVILTAGCPGEETPHDLAQDREHSYILFLVRSWKVIGG